LPPQLAKDLDATFHRLDAVVGNSDGYLSKSPRLAAALGADFLLFQQEHLNLSPI
jgi:hypothetical protein